MTTSIANAQTIRDDSYATLRAAHDWLRGPGQGAGSEATDAVIALASRLQCVALWLGLMTEAAIANVGVWEVPVTATTACLACADLATQLAELLDAQGAA